VLTDDDVETEAAQDRAAAFETGRIGGATGGNDSDLVPGLQGRWSAAPGVAHPPLLVM
jgi:hypothetical protein